MPFYCGLKEDGVALINNDGPMKLHKDQARELEERRARLFYLPATKLSLEVAGMDLATNMALMGAIGCITGLTTIDALAQAVKDRFIGKGFVVSGGTAALDSVVERKFKKKQELIDKNVAVNRCKGCAQCVWVCDNMAKHHAIKMIMIDQLPMAALTDNITYGEKTTTVLLASPVIG